MNAKHLALALLLASPLAAWAQTSGGAPATVHYDRDQDLPVDAPTFGKGDPKPPVPDPPPVPVDSPQPPTFYGKDLKSENSTIYYVIDISGSMGWDVGQYTTPDGQVANGCRLDRAKAELTKSILSLPKNFKFNVEAFDCAFQNWETSLQPADDSHKQAAIGWVTALQPQGATGTGPAVAAALQLRDNKLVVLLTDGGPNCGAGDGHGGHACRMAHLQMIDQANTQHAVINVFGIGATGDFRQFCMDIAADNNGSYTDCR